MHRTRGGHAVVAGAGLARPVESRTPSATTTNREEHLMMVRFSGAASWLTLAGTVILLLGLGLDAVLHKLDPSLAAREGVFAVHNPGHVLAAVGIVLTVFGAVLFLL